MRRLRAISALVALSLLPMLVVHGIALVTEVIHADDGYWNHVQRQKELASLQKRVRVNPRDGEAWLRLSVITDSNGNWNEQEHDLRMAVRADPRNEQYRHDHIVLLCSIKRHCEADKEFQACERANIFNRRYKDRFYGESPQQMAEGCQAEMDGRQ